jgi:glyoxylase-like metal-dependent hydrolase (beta-lactamase superfamily II)
MIQPNVVPGLHRIEDAYTNWFLLEEDGRLTVVDAGVPTSWGSLQTAVQKIGRSLSHIEAVILTHAHFDHVGFAERARRELGVPVYVHEDDVPLTHNPRLYGRERPVSAYLATQVKAAPIVASLLRNRAWFPPPVQRVERFTEGTLPVPGSPEVLATPGHTLGHVSFHLPERDAVIAGDALVMLDPYTGRRGPRLVARAATADVERNLRTLDALARCGARTVLSGHGEPWTAGAEAAVAAARAAGSA